MSRRVVVVGSANVDHRLAVDAMPGRDETVPAMSYVMELGGEAPSIGPGIRHQYRPRVETFTKDQLEAFARQHFVYEVGAATNGAIA